MPRTLSRSVSRRKSKKLKSPVSARRFSPFVAIGLFLIGLILLSFPTGFKYWESQKRPINQIARLKIPFISDKKSSPREPIRIDPKLLDNKETIQPPLRIVIPVLTIDLSIVEANVVDGTWELSDTSASHGIGSANPGQIGNTVIFAHAREGLFLPLKDVKKDESVYVLTKDRWYRYRIIDIKFVNPDKIEVIAPTSEEMLTLYTCSGFLDSKRLIVTAKPYRP